MTIIISAEQQNQRLDKFLVSQLTDQSRSTIQKMITRGQIVVNGKTTTAHYLLKLDDVITINKETNESDKKIVAKTEIADHLIPRIIAEDADILVIEKPAGLLVHPIPGKTDDYTLIDWLLKHNPANAGVGDNAYRAGLVHRLDKDVSGVMVIAKTAAAFDHLKQQFHDRAVHKEYIALVYGHLDQAKGTISLPIGRNKDGHFVAHPLTQWNRLFHPDDKPATTHYQVTDYIKEYTLLSVQIVTGRTHQIRAHFSAIGHPIIGDLIYQPQKPFIQLLRHKIKVVNPGRIFLHASRLSFTDLQGQRQEYQTALPNILEKYLATLRGNQNNSKQ